MDVLYGIGALLAASAAPLAWLAKLQWSKEYAAAKDETIKVMDARIAGLRERIASLESLTPMKVTEYFHAMESMLSGDFSSRSSEMPSPPYFFFYR